MIERRLQNLETAVLRLTSAVKELTDAYVLMTKTNPDTSAFVPDVIKRRRKRENDKQYLIDLFMDYTSKLGSDRGASLLESYGIDTIARLKPSRYNEAMQTMELALGRDQV